MSHEGLAGHRCPTHAPVRAFPVCTVRSSEIKCMGMLQAYPCHGSHDLLHKNSNFIQLYGHAHNIHALLRDGLVYLVSAHASKVVAVVTQEGIMARLQVLLIARRDGRMRIRIDRRDFLNTESMKVWIKRAHQT